MSSNNSPDEWKERGNNYFKKGNFKQSIDCYTKAIQLDPSNPFYFTNRSAAYFNIKQYQKSIEDAKSAINIDSSFDKGYYRLAHALLKLNKYKEALNAFLKVCELNQFNETSVKDYENAHKMYIDNYFRSISYDIPVHVKWINKEKGRGVFAVRDCEKGVIIFNDKPIVSHRKLSLTYKDLESCDYCMKVILKENQLHPFFGSQHKLIYKNKPSNWIYCEDCKDTLKVKYCSNSCKKKAWKEYHQLLCPLKWPDGLIEKYQEIINICEDNEYVQPLIVMRIFARILLQVFNEKLSLEDALEPFKLFEANEDMVHLENEIISFVTSLAEYVFGKSEDIEKIVNKKNYLFMNGILSRNAVSLNPVSDFHLYISELPDKQQNIIANIHKKGMTPKEFVQSEWMRRLTIFGTGLFLIGNSINHSCVPNVATASCYNDNTLSLITLRPIKSGEELYISYIDETLSYEERKKRLMEYYQFECDCPKCKEEINWTHLIQMSASKLKVYFPEIPLIIQPKRNRIATDGTVQFITKRNMTKIEIKNLLEKVYGVGVIKVNTMNYQPKYKRDFNRGNIYVKKKAWKKAIVTIDNTYYLDLLSKQDISDLKKATEESNE